jgi:hypothetical protein
MYKCVKCQGVLGSLDDYIKLQARTIGSTYVHTECEPEIALLIKKANGLADWD